jgi:hypothetical protein
MSVTGNAAEGWMLQVMEECQGDCLPVPAYLCVLIPGGPSEGRTLAERQKECDRVKTRLLGAS